MFKPGDRVLFNGCLGTVIADRGDDMYAVRMDGVLPVYLLPGDCLLPDDAADVPLIVKQGESDVPTGHPRPLPNPPR
jgi:hypothetical protein